MRTEQDEASTPSRRGFLKYVSAGIGAAADGPALAGTLADVPPREPGADLSGHSERSQYVKIGRIPEAGPGLRHVDPDDAINSKTPIGQIVGSITPTDLHYERGHSGVPNLESAKHRLLMHGIVSKPLVLTEQCHPLPASYSSNALATAGRTGKRADPNITVQNTHGLVSTNEWTGVPLRLLIDLVGVDGKSTWMLAEGDDAAGVARTIPLTDEILSEAFVAYGQKGEPLRPAHGFPIRLIMPGFEGNLNIKWLRRLKFGDQPWMTRWETARYTQLLANGKARQFQLRMETNSVITSPSGTMVTRPGYNRIMGLAWSGHGKITKIEVSTDAAKTWQPAKINGLALPKAQTRFQMDWVWDGKPTKIVSRSIDGKGNIQPDCASFIARMGTNGCFTTTLSIVTGPHAGHPNVHHPFLPQVGL
jgi:sulfane dehydrogenase subunit SoxC